MLFSHTERRFLTRKRRFQEIFSFRIHYPLPLEYTGHPDPAILQTQIKRLEDEIARLKNELMTRGNNKNDAKILAALTERYCNTYIYRAIIFDSNIENNVKSSEKLCFSF